jgi:DNA excision repair protein ERCC-1
VFVHRARQQHNPLLRHLRSVSVELVDDQVPDFVVGETACCIFIQVKYHQLHPDYLFGRIKELRSNWRLRVVLCYIDTDERAEPKKALLEIDKLALVHDCTLLLAWSWAEAARYIESFKVYEHKGAGSIQEKVNEADYLAKLTDVLTCVRSVNKSDAGTLASNFGTFKALATASRDELALCPGLGDKKVERIFNAFHKPFRGSSSSSATSSSSSSSSPSPPGSAKKQKTLAAAAAAASSTTIDASEGKKEQQQQQQQQQRQPPQKQKTAAEATTTEPVATVSSGGGRGLPSDDKAKTIVCPRCTLRNKATALVCEVCNGPLIH